MAKIAFRSALAAVALGLAFAPAAQAANNCRIQVSSGKCIFVTAAQMTPPDFIVGQEFPVYEHNMVLDVDRYSLKPVDGAWRYYKTGGDIYKVSTDDYTVLEIIRNAPRR